MPWCLKVLTVFSGLGVRALDTACSVAGVSFVAHIRAMASSSNQSDETCSSVSTCLGGLCAHLVMNDDRT